MHELAICQALLSQVESIAIAQQAQKVVEIVVGIGPLSGVEIPLLERAYSLARSGTLAAHAELASQPIEIRVNCAQCEKESEGSMQDLRCRHCGSWQTRVVAGDECILLQVSLDQEETTQYV